MSGDVLSASHEVLQQSEHITALLRKDLGSPDPTQTISLIKKESFKSIIKSREGVYLPNSYWELVPQIQALLPALLL